MDLDDHVCLCFRVSRRKLESYIRIYEPKVASQLSQCGGAGTGCGWCVPFLKRYFEEESQQTGRLNDSLTPEEYARQRGDYIKAGKGTPPSGAIPPPESP